MTLKGNIQNLIKVASAYGKESGLQFQINESDILYIDPNKNRTDSWLQARRLQLPVGVTKYDPVCRVTLLKRNVKGEFEVCSAMQRAFTRLRSAFSKQKNSRTAGNIAMVERLFMRALENKNGATANGQAGVGLEYSLIIEHADGTAEEIADARELTDEKALEYLRKAKSGELRRESYIPVRKDTPQIIIDTLKQVNEKIENLSLIMQVKKAQQSMGVQDSQDRNGRGGKNKRKHGLTPENILEIVNNLDNPNSIIYQTNRYGKNGELLPNNVAVFVDYKSDENEGLAVIEFESSINPDFIREEFGDAKYHTVVTVFEPDTERDGLPFDYVEELLQNPNNFELKIERRYPARSATGENHPNTSSKLPSNTIKAQNSFGVNSYDMQNGGENSQFSFGGVNGTDINVPYEGEAETESPSRGQAAPALAGQPPPWASPISPNRGVPFRQGGLDGREAANSQALQNLDEAAEAQGAVFAYQQAYKNDDVLQLVQKVKEGKHKDNEFVSFGMIDERTARRIQEITGIDVAGWKVEIEARQISHILKDHGENGLTDRSLANENDIAKMEYAIQNAEHIADGGTTSAYFNFIEGKNRRAKTILYQKQIGDQYYYVVEAVPQTKKKTLQIVGAFINKNKKIEGSYLTDAKSPDATSNDVGMTPSRDTAHRLNDVGRPVGYAMEAVSPKDSIRNPEENVKENSSTGFAEVEVQPQEIPEGTAGATETVYQPEAVPSRESERKKVAQGRTLEELEQELSDRELFNRAYMSEIIDVNRPPQTVEIQIGFSLHEHFMEYFLYFRSFSPQKRQKVQFVCDKKGARHRVYW